jgi:hypothetical protein
MISRSINSADNTLTTYYADNKITREYFFDKVYGDNDDYRSKFASPFTSFEAFQNAVRSPLAMPLLSVVLAVQHVVTAFKSAAMLALHVVTLSPAYAGREFARTVWSLFSAAHAVIKAFIDTFRAALMLATRSVATLCFVGYVFGSAIASGGVSSATFARDAAQFSYNAGTAAVKGVGAAAGAGVGAVVGASTAGVAAVSKGGKHAYHACVGVFKRKHTPQPTTHANQPESDAGNDNGSSFKKEA